MITTWWPAENEAVPTLIGYTGGPTVFQVTAKSEAAAIDQGLEELTAYFGSQVRGHFLKGQVVDWTHDKWARGGYSYASIGIGHARFSLAESVESTLFFAGEASNLNGHAATVHGAVETGWRAADEVLRPRE